MTSIKRMRLFFSLALMLVMVTPAVTMTAKNKGVEPGTFTQDLDAARAYAKAHDLPIMLMFTGSDWCFWCKLMDKNVFTDEFFSYAKDHLVLVAIDYPRDKSKVPAEYVSRNKKLGERFGIRGVPTYVLLNPNGVTEIGRLGAGKEKTPKSFIGEIEALLKRQ